MLELIAKFKKGELTTKLATNYGTWLQTICNLKNNKKNWWTSKGTETVALDLLNVRVW